MPETAESIHADIKARRSITIELLNATHNYCLINPRVFLDNGETHNPPQPTVRPKVTELCTFTKSGGKATGAAGVLTYDMYEKNQRSFIETIAIMFSVPWDYNFYKNWYGVGIFDKGIKRDEPLYKKMYYDKKPEGFKRAAPDESVSIDYVGNYLDIKATMSPMENAIMKVEVWDKIFTPVGQERP